MSRRSDRRPDPPPATTAAEAYAHAETICRRELRKLYREQKATSQAHDWAGYEAACQRADVLRWLARQLGALSRAAAGLTGGGR